MPLPDYSCALYLGELVVSRQPPGHRRSVAGALLERLKTMIADAEAPSRIDAGLALFDCMFSGLHARENHSGVHRLADRTRCELCGSSVKIHEGMAAPLIGLRHLRICRSCGIRSEAPARWEPVLRIGTSDRLDLELPDDDDSAIACAAVITTGAWASEDRVLRKTIRRQGSIGSQELDLIEYRGCPVFMRVAVASAGRQATVFVRSFVDQYGKLSFR